MPAKIMRFARLSRWVFATLLLVSIELAACGDNSSNTVLPATSVPPTATPLPVPPTTVAPTNPLPTATTLASTPTPVPATFTIAPLPTSQPTVSITSTTTTFKTSRTTPPASLYPKPSPAGVGTNSDDKFGQELVGQIISADDLASKTDIRVLKIEARPQIKYASRSLNATGIFLIMIAEVASLGKEPAGPLAGVVELQDSKGRTFTVSQNSNPNPNYLLEKLDPQTYPDISNVSSGFVRKATFVFDLPKDATGLKLLTAGNGLVYKNSRRPAPEDFKNSGGAGPDSDAGPELSGKTFSNKKADYTVTKVARLSVLTIGGQPAITTDGVFIVIGFAIKNNGSENAVTNPFKLTDDLQRSYYDLLLLSSSFDFTKDFPSTGSAIPANGVGKSFALFEIPKDAKDLSLVLKDN